MAGVQLVQSTIETVPVTVRDLTGVITTLDSTTPTFDVVTVDPDTDEDDAPVVTAVSCLNSGMMLQPLINTTMNGVGTDAPLWDRGKYRMYITFVPGDGEMPRLGPFELFVI